jgi:ABC-type multidrug transport system fused ATPase/permease subunit
MALSPDISWPAARIRRDLFERITIQDVGFFDQQKTGELMNRLASDTTGRPITMNR